MSASFKLLTAASATGAGVDVTEPGEYVFSAAGTFGGASVGLSMLGPDGLTWIPLKDSAGVMALTSADAVIVSLPVGTYRGTITGGAGVSMHASLAKVT